MLESQKAFFQAQFSHRRQVSVGGGRVEAVYIHPASEESRDVTILLAPGWSETIDVNRVALEELFNLGRRAVTLSHARRGIQTTEGAVLPKAVERKTASLLATLDYFGIDQVDVIAHSEGGINAAFAALQYPRRVRNMVIIGSGGLLPQDNLLRLTARLINEGIGMMLGSGKTQSRPVSMGEAMGNIAKYVISNPLWSLEETQAIAQQKSLDLLKTLQVKRIGISLIHNVDDRLFPILSLDSRLNGMVGRERLAGFYSVLGNHNAILGDPRITRLAVNALDSLQYRRKRLSS